MPLTRRPPACSGRRRAPAPRAVLLGPAALLAAALPAGAVPEPAPAANSTPGTVLALGEGASGPVVDGLVTDPQWENAEPFTGFIQQEPDNGAPATERTEVRLLLSHTTLYVGIIAFDREPERVLVSESRRDGDLNESDSVQIVLDTFDDNQNAFLFGTNPEGIEYDGQIAGEGATGGYNPRPGQRGSQRGGVTGFNANWDGDWTVRSRQTGRGWETEFAIPLRTLRYEAGEGRTWGLNVMRNIRRKNEQSFLAPIPRGYNLYRVSLARKISGLDLPRRRDLRVTPFALGDASRNPLAAASANRSRNTFDLGLDVKWGVTPNLTVDITANTDFAQVEADDQQINLTRFPLFFPEKRPFFLENASTFQFGAPQEVDLFFSRRIGLHAGRPVGIIGGARMSGKVGAWNLGVMNMQTEAAFDPESGALLLTANNFAVARVQREVGRSSFGGIFVNRQGTGDRAGENDANRAFGADAAVQIGEHARFFTFLAKTATAGEESASASDTLAGRAFLNYADPLHQGHLGFTQVGEDFDPQVGFVPRRGYRKYQARYYLDWQPVGIPGMSWVRRFSPHVTWNAYYGFDGEVQSGRGHWHPIEFQPNGGGRFGIFVDRMRDRPLTDFTVFSGADGSEVTIPPGLYEWSVVTVNYLGNASARLYPTAYCRRGGFYDGDRRGCDLSLNGRVGARFQASVGWNRDIVSLPGGDFTTDLVPVRLNYSFTPLRRLEALIQYNSQSASVSSNIRLVLLDRSGTGLFVVYNDLRNTANFDRFDWDTGLPVPTVMGRSLIVKYTRLFDF